MKSKQSSVPEPDQRVTIELLRQKKRRGVPIVMLTAYDHPSAQVVETAGVDLVLVGDTGAETVLGYPATVHVSLDEMISMASAVRRGLRTPILIGDLPFGSYEASDELAVASAQRFVKEAGCDVVKLERGGASVERASAIVASGIPAMGHVGLTPQSQAALSGRRAQGLTAGRAFELLEGALALEAAGCFAVVFEAVPAEVAAAISARLSVPTIGIGAGGGTDGQVLVWHDLLGLYEWRPRFAKAYADLRPQMLEAVERYAREVRSGAFPSDEHCYTIAVEQLEDFEAQLERAGGEWDD
jgi:3-methyl-2-oxobutanoate hydroxymethyltransferase